MGHNIRGCAVETIETLDVLFDDELVNLVKTVKEHSDNISGKRQKLWPNKLCILTTSEKPQVIIKNKVIRILFVYFVSKILTHLEIEVARKIMRSFSVLKILKLSKNERHNMAQKV